MKIDLLHNKIVADSVTELFTQSFTDNVVPVLEDKYGASLVGVQMYEDYLADGFVYDGEFYYPLTLVFEDCQGREWIKWSVADKKSFADGIPYAYVGKGVLEFGFVDTVPMGFEEKIASRANYFEGGYIPLNIDFPSVDKNMLIGKYSQTFIDEMTRQITREIEKAFSITGIADSTVTLSLSFAPGTFMEHVVDGVTYRRLLISAKGCAPRDLWIKWYGKNGQPTLTVSSCATEGEVSFELGEDVSNKIREKEYRYLVRSSADKYQTAMGRKNITEWRDLIKRVIKRGEVDKVEVVSIDTEKSSELTLKLQEVLGVAPVSEAPVEKEHQKDTNSDLEALLKGVLGVSDDVEQEDEKSNEALDLFAVAESADIEDKDEEITLAEDDIAEEEKEEISEQLQTEQTFVEKESVTESYEDELRKKIEAEIRERLELEAKEKAHEESERLRREHEALKAENERLAELARRAEADKLAIEQKNAEEAEKLRSEIESRERAEAREKERMAEAARLALLEQQRLAEARAEEERRLKEAEEKAREEERRAKEEEILAEQRRLEQERIRADMEARAREEANAKLAEQERALAIEKERQEALRAQESKKAQPTYTYVSKVARLLFKHRVDPNVTKRIHEIILTTIKYFHKEDVYIKIRATIPDSTTVHLHFEKIPAEENELLINIIKVLGKSDLGITKVYLE